LVFKNKPILQVAALVEAMFMAELKNLLLTAGHDLEQIEPPVRVDVAAGTESYVRMNGEEQVLKAGDMLIADARGILSCILYGPDRRTRIQPETTGALFTVYAPPGISVDAVRRHLADLRDNAALVAPGAMVVQLQVFAAR
jgi:DNA/RNA-binding domain of Phe-tRNA-synthetase-like protein